jgi:hypothetical protein
MATETALLDEIISRVRILAEDDPEVLQLLEAFARGVVEQATVMRETGMTSREYLGARIRMRKLFAMLPAEVQRAVFETGSSDVLPRDGLQRT